MKAVAVVGRIFFLSFFLGWAGCESAPEDADLLPVADDDFNQLSVYLRYTPVKIDIMPLTEFINVGNDEEDAKIKIYVSPLDSFGCQQKAPGIFRFELYEIVPHSAKRKGKRIVIWPDMDLTKPGKNNGYWRDFLRAYEFKLDFEPQANQTYILQATCLCPNGRRLSADFPLRHTK